MLAQGCIIVCSQLFVLYDSKLVCARVFVRVCFLLVYPGVLL